VGLKITAERPAFTGNKNEIQIAHVLFRDSDIWDPPVAASLNLIT
jgi:hypothetical protein